MANILKYVGAAYIAYLAIYVARSKPDGGESNQMSFMKIFLLEFVNVKIILYAITVYTGYVWLGVSLHLKSEPLEMIFSWGSLWSFPCKIKSFTATECNAWLRKGPESKFRQGQQDISLKEKLK